MTGEKTDLQNKTPQPADEAAEAEGKTKKVGTEAQEEAAKDREESGGYQ